MNIGIWIDHREAVLVSIENGAAEVSRLASGVEPRPHASGGRKAGGTLVAQSITNEQRIDERYRQQLHNFYQEVIRATGRAEMIYIFGPGEARNELVKEIEKIKRAHPLIAAVEACDKLTEPQIAAKAKAFFHK
jgi:hypothetical protein